MTKANGTAKKDKAEFFKFTEKGDSISGKLLGVVKTIYNYALKLQLDDGREILVKMNAVIAGLVQANIRKISPGDDISIEYDGETKGTKFKYKLFIVEVNGERLQGGFRDMSLSEFADEIRTPF